MPIMPLNFMPSHIAAMARINVNANVRSAYAGLVEMGEAVGLCLPHRLAQFMAQVIHESGRFRYDRELWGKGGGTAAQKRYDTRTDLGNTPERDGDGYLYRGRSPIQVTGKANYQEFTEWARARMANAPNFVAAPDLLTTDPWEGIAPLWYWDTRGLNKYADEGNIEMVTRRINGGLNGYADRLECYDAAALVLLGYEPDAVSAFQRNADLTPDGISGPKTRAALHAALKDRMPVSFNRADAVPESLAPQGIVVGEVSKAEARSPAETVLIEIRQLLDAHFVTKGDV